MFRIVYWDGIVIKEKWFETDKEQLEFSKSNRKFKILEWKKYECRENARSLESFIV
jgi:hypothetical protein